MVGGFGFVSSTDTLDHEIPSPIVVTLVAHWYFAHEVVSYNQYTMHVLFILISQLLACTQAIPSVAYSTGQRKLP